MLFKCVLATSTVAPNAWTCSIVQHLISIVSNARNDAEWRSAERTYGIVLDGWGSIVECPFNENLRTWRRSRRAMSIGDGGWRGVSR